jgi:hypothetical protein
VLTDKSTAQCGRYAKVDGLCKQHKKTIKLTILAAVVLVSTLALGQQGSITCSGSADHASCHDSSTGLTVKTQCNGENCETSDSYGPSHAEVKACGKAFKALKHDHTRSSYNAAVTACDGVNSVLTGRPLSDGWLKYVKEAK